MRGGHGGAIPVLVDEGQWIPPVQGLLEHAVGIAVQVEISRGISTRGHYIQSLPRIWLSSPPPVSVPVVLAVSVIGIQGQVIRIIRRAHCNNGFVIAGRIDDLI